VPERAARETVRRVIDAIKLSGIPTADEHYPTIRREVREAAVTQLQRLADSESW